MTRVCARGGLAGRTEAKLNTERRYDVSFPPLVRALNLVTNAHTMQPCAHK